MDKSFHTCTCNIPCYDQNIHFSVGQLCPSDRTLTFSIYNHCSFRNCLPSKAYIDEVAVLCLPFYIK